MRAFFILVIYLSRGILVSQIKVGICGLGTVGGGTFHVLKRNAEEITQRVGAAVEVVHIGMRTIKPEYDTSGIQVSSDIFDVAKDPNVDIVVETIGGTTIALALVLEAIANKKHVVTANKALIAEHGNQIFAAAKEQGVSVAYEAAVAGGIPIIKAFREGLSANKINWLAGIINGTGNFILTEMRDNKTPFDEVLKRAQELGYAEADPTFDVEGIDAAHKLVILASIAFGIPLQFNRLYTQGISAVETDDIEYAQKLGYEIKHLGIARRSEVGIEMRVHPTLVPHSRLISKVDGVMNAVMVNGDAVGTTMYYGAGAGAEPTASSIIADVVDISRQIATNSSSTVPYLGIQSKDLSSADVLDINQCETAMYLRFNVADQTGVLAEITQLFSESAIGVDAIHQNEPAVGETEARIILVTHRAKESELVAVADALQNLNSVKSKVVRIRVEDLD